MLATVAPNFTCGGEGIEGNDEGAENDAINVRLCEGWDLTCDDPHDRAGRERVRPHPAPVEQASAVPDSGASDKQQGFGLTIKKRLGYPCGFRDP